MTKIDYVLEEKCRDGNAKYWRSIERDQKEGSIRASFDYKSAETPDKTLRILRVITVEEEIAYKAGDL